MNSQDTCFSNAIIELKKHFNAHKDLENLEVEFRLGYIEKGKFNPDIGQLYYNNLIYAFDNSNAWHSVQKTKSTDYFFDSKRLTVHENGDSVCIKKEKLKNIDFEFQGTGFDLRVSFSKEIPTEKFSLEKSNYVRIKERTSYCHEHLSYDLTKVEYIVNAVKNYSYSIELEIKKLPLMSIGYLFHDALLKMKDIADICEEIEDLDELYLMLVNDAC